MHIKRDELLNQLKIREQNGLIKVITGMRRSGKSYLLFRLFREDLRARQIKDQQIIEVSLDDIKNAALRDPHALYNNITQKITNQERYYIFIDEIQFVPQFEDVLNGLLHLENVDIYVTGSNSKFLSSDVITEFRGRGDQVHVHPLSFSEFFSAHSGDFADAWNDYLNYGGLPRILSLKTETQKVDYLTRLFRETYLRDILERHDIRHFAELDELIQIISSSIGSLTNPSKLENTFKSVKGSAITSKTIKTYIDQLKDAFLIDQALRYDVKGKKYINTPHKYYFTDVGVRNAIIGFRHFEESRIMENIIFNELKNRGYSVDVGAVEMRKSDASGKSKRIATEIDFIAHRGRDKYYIQSAYMMPDAEKRELEMRPLLAVKDSFKKIIIDGSSPIKLHRNEQGITFMNIKEFLMNRDSLDA